MSRRLVELKRDIPLPEPLSALETRMFDSAALAAFLEAQNFTSLAKKMGMAGQGGGRCVICQPPPPDDLHRLPLPALPTKAGIHRWNQGRAARRRSGWKRITKTVTDETALMRWVDEAIRLGTVAVDTETTSLSAVDAELVGISLSTRPGHACYIPVGHVSEMAAAPTSQGSLFDAPVSIEKKLVPGQLSLPRVLELLQPLLTHPAVLKIGHNLKYDLVVLTKYDVTIAPLADTMLMSYCIGGGLHAHGLDFLADRYFGHKMVAFTDVTGTGKSQKNFSEVPLDAATYYAAEDADFTLRLHQALQPQLIADHVVGVYETIERPLVPVIARMEAAGVAIDVAALAGLSSQFMLKINALEQEIIALAGMPFSVGSPKQLGEVLYDKLQLGGARKSSKTGAYTTDASTLEALAEEGHEIARKVLEWRQYAKLKSTYTDALPKAISPARWAGAYELFDGGDHDGPVILQRPEPPEHPDPFGGGPSHPHGVHRAARLPAYLGGLFADRAAPCSPIWRIFPCCARHSGPARIFMR